MRYGPLWPCSLLGTEPRAGSRHATATFLVGLHRVGVSRRRGGLGDPPSACGRRRSAALTLLAPPNQLLDRARQSRLEVDQLRPGRYHDDPDHTVVIERPHLRLPFDPLLSCHLIGAGGLEILVRDAIDEV